LIKKIQHIGIAVRNLDDALIKYTELLGLKLISREVVESRGIEIALLDGSNTMIELIADHSEKSTIHNFLEKRGEGLHHIAFDVENIQHHLDQLKNHTIKLIDEKPRTGALSSKVAFIYPDDFCGVLIELCEE
jgi:methylmalonyl-CoA/ethylmalonyl-CoA epimerase